MMRFWKTVSLFWTLPNLFVSFSSPGLTVVCALHTVSPAEENYTFPVWFRDSIDVFSLS